MNRRLAPLAAALLIVVLCAAPAADAATDSASGGSVTAKLTYTKKNSYTYRNLHLKIVRDGVTALDVPIKTEACGSSCWPAGAGFGQSSSLAVRDLDGDGEPEVTLDLYSGGAHCCLVTQFYEFVPPAPGGTPSYAMKEHDFLDAGYKVKDLNGDGIPELRSDDARLRGVISSYAGSGSPVQILRFQHGELADVTREFPVLIKADSKQWWRQYRRYIRKPYPDNDPGLGGLVAWAADQYLLGHGDKADSELKAALKRGWLRSPIGSGKRTLRELNKALKQTGYR